MEVISLISFYKFLQGFVKIRIAGYSPERFMNLCSNHHILLWDIENHHGDYVMCMSVRSFFRIKPFLRKTNTKVSILEKYGLPFLFPRLVKRKVFLIGMVAIVFLLIRLSNYIWGFEFEGNIAITDEYLLSYLKEQNVYYGTAKAILELKVLEEDVLKDFELISWVSVRIEGTKLVISVKENEYHESDVLKQQQEQNKIRADVCTNLVTTKEGVIASIITRAGIPLVKEGDIVEVGQCLVEGNIPIYQDDGTLLTYQYTNSDASITIQTTYPYEEEVELVYDTIVYTDNAYSNYFVEIGERIFYLTGKKNTYLQYDYYTLKHQVKILDHFYLPIYYGSTQVSEYHKTQLFRTEEEATTVLMEKMDLFHKSLIEKGIQILSNNVKIEVVDEKMVAKGEYILLESCIQTISVDMQLLEAELPPSSTKEYEEE